MVKDFEGILKKERFKHLTVSVEHAFLAGHIPAAHKDPFDRMIAAQCRLENLSLITIEAAFGEFGIDTIW